MNTSLIKPMTAEYTGYLRDESRRVGSAESISFPQSHSDVVAIVSDLNRSGQVITIQGAQTGITGGAVAAGGHLLNLSRLNKISGMRYEASHNSFYITVGPGLSLSELQTVIYTKEFDTTDWSVESRATLDVFKSAGDYIFPPDPTEAGASIGGMIACNASGARSYRYGATRRYVDALRVVLADSFTLELNRQNYLIHNRSITLDLPDRQLLESLPDYEMPQVKNASGYFCCNDMPLIDLFIGSEGTLGIVTEAEIRLIPAPLVQAALLVFFPSTYSAVHFVKAIRGTGVFSKPMSMPVAIEFFNADALELVLTEQLGNFAFATLPRIPKNAGSAIYVEFHGENDVDVRAAIDTTVEAVIACGGSDDTILMADSLRELERFKVFRHAIPEIVNLTIDRRRKAYPEIAKLGTDMAVPDNSLESVVKMYTDDLAASGLESVIFGHIGDNHLHVNILPHNDSEFSKGKELYRRWAVAVIAMGGTISAEHGVGKSKKDLLLAMYGIRGVQQMKQLKSAFDPLWRLNSGTLFDR